VIKLIPGSHEGFLFTQSKKNQSTKNKKAPILFGAFLDQKYGKNLCNVARNYDLLLEEGAIFGGLSDSISIFKIASLVFFLSLRM